MARGEGGRLVYADLLRVAATPTGRRVAEFMRSRDRA